jgi:hypothetical protein
VWVYCVVGVLCVGVCWCGVCWCGVLVLCFVSWCRCVVSCRCVVVACWRTRRVSAVHCVHVFFVVLPGMIGLNPFITADSVQTMK